MSSLNTTGHAPFGGSSPCCCGACFRLRDRGRLRAPGSADHVLLGGACKTHSRLASVAGESSSSPKSTDSLSPMIAEPGMGGRIGAAASSSHGCVSAQSLAAAAECVSTSSHPGVSWARSGLHFVQGSAAVLQCGITWTHAALEAYPVASASHTSWKPQLGSHMKRLLVPGYH